MRPANVIPVVCGLLFGPAGAWGAAFGNLIGDFFGTLGIGSFFGFWGNFLAAYLPYKIWQNRPLINIPRHVPRFVAAVLLGAMSCALVIGFGVEAFHLLPFSIITVAVLVNNGLVSLILGPLLLRLLAPRVGRWDLAWREQMDPEDCPRGPARRPGPGPGVAGRRRRLPGRPGPGVWSGNYPGAADLHFRYKKAARPVFAGLNLTVRAGERLTILGPSEAGKSTLGLCLQGLIPRLIKGEIQGRVAVAGVDTLSARPRDLAARVGLLFQDFEAQLFCTRVDQEVAFGPENLALPREELRRRVTRTWPWWASRDFRPGTRPASPAASANFGPGRGPGPGTEAIGPG